MKRPQISLRTMLWLMALLAVALGWFVDRRRLEERAENAERIALNEKQYAEDLELYAARRDRELAAITKSMESSGREIMTLRQKIPAPTQ